MEGSRAGDSPPFWHTIEGWENDLLKNRTIYCCISCKIE
jgi:hypothetical protein